MVLRFIATTALAPLARILTRKKPRVLFYHRFGDNNERTLSARLFEEQILFLKRHFNLVPLSVITEALSEGGPLPENSVALTVDDGYVDFFEVAYPVIKKHAVPITVFLVSAFCADGAWLWYDTVRYVCVNAKQKNVLLEADGKQFKLDLSCVQGQESAWDEICSFCLQLSTEKRTTLIAAFASVAEVSVPKEPPNEFRGMNPVEIKSMDLSLVEIGAHTRTHAILSSCDKQEQRIEITKSKSMLEALTGRPVVHFAYPNGQTRDFNDTSVSLVKVNAFKGAVTVEGTLVDENTDVFRIPRLCASFDMDVFRNEVNGLSFLNAKFRTFLHKLRAKQ